MITPSELILNDDGSIYHLHLKPGQLADTVILVGDPGRVALMASFLDTVMLQSANREYVSITGYYNAKRISIVSTGIGIGNIDIAINELDALVNIDFKKREIKKNKKKLSIIRVGTSGLIQEGVPINSFILTSKSIGLDGLLNFYEESSTVYDLSCTKAFKSHMMPDVLPLPPYAVGSSRKLYETLRGEKTISGITMTSPGFYVPQGRQLRLKPEIKDINKKIAAFEYNGEKVINYEMESAPIYGLSRMLGHEAITICLGIANRQDASVNTNYKEKMEELAIYTLKKITA